MFLSSMSKSRRLTSTFFSWLISLLISHSCSSISLLTVHQRSHASLKCSPAIASSGIEIISVTTILFSFHSFLPLPWFHQFQHYSSHYAHRLFQSFQACRIARKYNQLSSSSGDAFNQPTARGFNWTIISTFATTIEVSFDTRSVRIMFYDILSFFIIWS